MTHDKRYGMASGEAAATASVIALNGDHEHAVPSVARLATLVRRAREKRGWSQTVLAETAHVEHDVIHRLEAGKSDPPFSLVADLVRILELQIEHAVFNQKVAKQVREAGRAAEQESK